MTHTQQIKAVGPGGKYWEKALQIAPGEKAYIITADKYYDKDGNYASPGECDTCGDEAYAIVGKSNYLCHRCFRERNIPTPTTLTATKEKIMNTKTQSTTQIAGFTFDATFIQTHFERKWARSKKNNPVFCITEAGKIYWLTLSHKEGKYSWTISVGGKMFRPGRWFNTLREAKLNCLEAFVAGINKSRCEFCGGAKTSCDCWK